MSALYIFNCFENSLWICRWKYRTEIGGGYFEFKTNQDNNSSKRRERGAAPSLFLLSISLHLERGWSRICVFGYNSQVFTPNSHWICKKEVKNWNRWRLFRVQNKSQSKGSKEDRERGAALSLCCWVCPCMERDVGMKDEYCWDDSKKGHETCLTFRFPDSIYPHHSSTSFFLLFWTVRTQSTTKERNNERRSQIQKRLKSHKIQICI